MCFCLFGCSYNGNDVDHISSTLAISNTAININTASAIEIERIPFIGEKLALKIVEHREMHGPFRRPEHIMLIQGISDRRFRQIKHLIKTE